MAVTTLLDAEIVFTNADDELFRTLSDNAWEFIADELTGVLPSLRHRTPPPKGAVDRFREALANGLLVIQWEVLTRNLVKENLKRRFVFEQATNQDVRPICPTELLSAFCEKVGQRLGERGIEHSDRLRKTEQEFTQLLEMSSQIHPWAYDDLVNTFAEPFARAERLPVYERLFVSDGELTFYSLLWLFRRLNRLQDRKNVSFRKWLEGRTERDTSFQPALKLNVENSLSWEPTSLADFGQTLGLLSQSSREQTDAESYILTPRYASFLMWLERLHYSGLPDRYPFKRVSDDGAVQELRDAIKQYLQKSKKELTNTLSNFFTCASGTIDIGTFGEILVRFMDSLGPLLEGPLNRDLIEQYPRATGARGLIGWTDIDQPLFRICRAPFLPIEYIFRAYKPFPIHLVNIAMDFEKVDHWWTGARDVPRVAPVTLAFASVVGRVHEPKSEEESLARPITLLLSAIGEQATLGLYKDSVAALADSKGASGESQVLAHELGQISSFLEIRELGSASMWDWDEACKALPNCPEEGLYSGGVFTPYRETYEGVANYIHFLADAKSVRSIFDKLIGRSITEMMTKLVSWTKTTVFAATGRDILEKTPSDLMQPEAIQRYKKATERFATDLRIEPILRTQNTDDFYFPSGDAVQRASPTLNGAEARQVVRWMAKAIAAALLNAAKHCSSPTTTDDPFYPGLLIFDYQVGEAGEGSRVLFIVANPSKYSIEPAPPRSGTLTILQRVCSQIREIGFDANAMMPVPNGSDQFGLKDYEENRIRELCRQQGYEPNEFEDMYLTGIEFGGDLATTYLKRNCHGRRENSHH